MKTLENENKMAPADVGASAGESEKRNFFSENDSTTESSDCQTSPSKNSALLCPGASFSDKFSILSCAVGSNEAIIIRKLQSWLETNEKNRRNFFDGRYWTFNTYENWKRYSFPWISLRTLRRMFKELEEKELLIVGNYNKKGYDKTKWYSINYEKLEDAMDKARKKIEEEYRESEGEDESENFPVSAIPGDNVVTTTVQTGRTASVQTGRTNTNVLLIPTNYTNNYITIDSSNPIDDLKEKVSIFLKMENGGDFSQNSSFPADPVIMDFPAGAEKSDCDNPETCSKSASRGPVRKPHSGIPKLPRYPQLDPEILDFMDWYLLEYKKRMGKNHPFLKKEQIFKVHNNFANFLNAAHISAECLEASAYNYFENAAVKTDYNINHFSCYYILLHRTQEEYLVSNVI